MRTKILSLEDLTDVIVRASRRADAFEAIAQMRSQYPAESEGLFETILTDPEICSRSKAILLYYLREFGFSDGLVIRHISPLQKYVDGVAKDIESETIEEDGIDPFRTDGFPHE